MGLVGPLDSSKVVSMGDSGCAAATVDSMNAAGDLGMGLPKADAPGAAKAWMVAAAWGDFRSARALRRISATARVERDEEG